MKPFDYVNDINQGKQNLMRGTENDKLSEESYVPYLTNMALSMFPDTILHANEMNMRPDTPKRAQYEFLLNSVRPAKRYGGSWPKKLDNEALEIVCETYNCNFRLGKEYLALLSDDQIDYLKEQQKIGGTYGHNETSGGD
jgi:hypothetical protein